MNTLAKVLRNDSAAAVLSFQPNELAAKLGEPGIGTRPSARLSTGASGDSHAYEFPVLDLSGGGRSEGVLHNGHGTHHHTFPAVAELPAISATSAGGESEKTTLEIALREKTIQEARAAAEAGISAQIVNLREDLSETIARVSGLANEISAKLETEVVELALEIAKKVVAREVSIDREVVLSVTKSALSKLQSRTLASIHLHPDDLAYISEHRGKLNFHGSLELIEDGSLAPGGCLIHTDTGDIDGRIESQFDEITNGLLGTGTD